MRGFRALEVLGTWHVVASSTPAVLFETPALRICSMSLPFAVYTSRCRRAAFTAFTEPAVEMWGRAPKLGEFWCGSHRALLARWPAHAAWRMSDGRDPQDRRGGARGRGDSGTADGKRIQFAPYPTVLREPRRNHRRRQILVDWPSAIQRRPCQRAFRRHPWNPRTMPSSRKAWMASSAVGTRAPSGCFGYTAQEAVGRHVSLLIPEDRLNEEPGIIERIRSGEASTIMKPSGGTRMAR